jgi:hypothetical protein
MMRDAPEACRCLQMFANDRESLRRERISREERQEREGEVGFLEKAPKTGDVFF